MKPSTILLMAAILVVANLSLGDEDPPEVELAVPAPDDLAIEPAETELKGHFDGVSHVAFFLDGSLLVSSGPHDVIRFWEWREGKAARNLREDRTIKEEGEWRLAVSSDNLTVYGLGRMPNGTMVLKVWDAVTGKAGGQLPAQPRGLIITSMAVSPVGNLVATTGYDQRNASKSRGVYLWDGKSGRRAGFLKSPGNVPADVSFSADGKFIAVCQEGFLRIWTTKGRAQREFVLPRMLGSGTVKFSPDGTKVAVAARMHFPLPGGQPTATLALWDLKSGKGLWSSTTLAGPIDFSPDGQYLVVNEHESKAVSVLDTESGKEIRRYRIQTESSTIAFSPDGRYLAVDGEEDVLVLDLKEK